MASLSPMIYGIYGIKGHILGGGGVLHANTPLSLSALPSGSIYLEVEIQRLNFLFGTKQRDFLFIENSIGKHSSRFIREIKKIELFKRLVFNKG